MKMISNGDGIWPLPQKCCSNIMLFSQYMKYTATDSPNLSHLQVVVAGFYKGTREMLRKEKMRVVGNTMDHFTITG